MEDDETVVTPNVLTFYEHNHEINELHRTFNSIVKTMLLAHHQDENENMALQKTLQRLTVSPALEHYNSRSHWLIFARKGHCPVT